MNLFKRSNKESEPKGTLVQQGGTHVRGDEGLPERHENGNMQQRGRRRRAVLCDVSLPAQRGGKGPAGPRRGLQGEMADRGIISGAETPRA